MSDSLQVVGPQYGGTGTLKPFSAETTGAQRVADAHARLWDAVRNGNVYSLSARGLTLAAGQGYAQAAAATINFVFWNPPNSGRLANLLKFAFGTISGTPAAGEVNYQLAAGCVISTASNGVHVNNSTGSTSGSAMRSRVNASAAAIAGTTAFTDCRPAFIQTAAAAATTTSTMCVDNLDGEFILQPGMAWTFGVGGAGTSWLASAGLLWEEIPLLV